MEQDTFDVEAEVEKTHWWFVGRRKLLARTLRLLPLDRDAAVLEVGVGTGANLSLLRAGGFGAVAGIDISRHAIDHCRRKGLDFVREADVCSAPYGDASFDLVVAMDILEHISDDSLALDEIHRILKPGGFAVLTVPAFASLWGLQDRVAHHQRRYRQRDLLARVRSAGLEPVEAFYFNFLLFVPIWISRRLIDLFRISLASENSINTPWVNRILGLLFRLDVAVAPLVRPPFGVSIMALCKKPARAAAADARSRSAQAA
jgi:SAM-dependent methyltransferase